MERSTRDNVIDTLGIVVLAVLVLGLWSIA